jgi:hypothetical protein
VMPSSETETCSRGHQLSIEMGHRSRGRPSPERGGIPPEGATDSRARQNLTRGGGRPSIEAELYRCGTVPLERSGIPPEGGQADCLVGRGPVGSSCACS